jgi:hypothetical protein
MVPIDLEDPALEVERRRQMGAGTYACVFEVRDSIDRGHRGPGGRGSKDRVHVLALGVPEGGKRLSSVCPGL